MPNDGVRLTFQHHESGRRVGSFRTRAAPPPGLARMLSAMNRRSPLLALTFALLIVMTGCGRESPVDTYMSDYGGSRANYERIADMTDCESLEAEYQSAAANNAVAGKESDAESWTAGYMAAAEDRLEELDCPRR